MVTTTDTDALTERLWDAIFEARDLPGKTGEASTMSIVEAILPIIAAEVQAAKAEALREAAGDIVRSAETLPHMTPHDAARGLVRRADRIESGDSDEHR